MDQTDFSWALRMLKIGKRVARTGWNGKGMWLTLATYARARVDLTSTKTSTLSDFIVMKTADNTLVPWLASQTDLLAEDWELASA